MAIMSKSESGRENITVVVVGHVDHGKSTVIGRMMADNGSLPQGKLDQVRENCRRHSRPFEYAHLLDALRDEQEQGITIDSARCFFKTQQRDYIIIDAPGHIEFLKNMVSGAARADAAILVIDAKQGIQENSRRHGYLLSLLGIRQVCVLVNKMDLVEYQESVFMKIKTEYSAILKGVGVEPVEVIPVSGFYGDNLIAPSCNMYWHNGVSLLGAMEKFIVPGHIENASFRMPVQGVYKFTADGDERRIVAGTICSGKLSKGAEIVFYPSGKHSTVKSLETMSGVAPEYFMNGQAASFTLNEQIYVKRGEIAALKSEQRPHISTIFRANLLWLGNEPLGLKKKYALKLGTARVSIVVKEIRRILDTSTLEHTYGKQVNRHSVAECIIECQVPISFDLADDNPLTGRFVLIDNYDIAGGGIILEDLSDHLSDRKKKVKMRNYNWAKSEIVEKDRIEQYGQRSVLVLITGPRDCGKKMLARTLEKNLFENKRVVYFLGIGSVLYGVDSDIKGTKDESRQEHIRRMAEIANIMLDAGVILVVTAIDLTQDDYENICTSVDAQKIIMVWKGDEPPASMPVDLNILLSENEIAAADKIKDYIFKKGFIFTQQ